MLRANINAQRERMRRRAAAVRYARVAMRVTRVDIRAHAAALFMLIRYALHTAFVLLHLRLC